MLCPAVSLAAGTHADTGPPSSDLIGLSSIPFAVIDESAVIVELHVAQNFDGRREGRLGDATNPFTSIREAMLAVVEFGLSRGRARDSLLVIKGPDAEDVTWTGTDCGPMKTGGRGVDRSHRRQGRLMV